MTVRRRLSLIAAAYIVVTLLGGLFTIWRAQQWTSALNQRRDWMVAAEHAARVRAAYADQETGERGYLITGEADFLQPYTQGTADARTVTSQLDHLRRRRRAVDGGPPAGRRRGRGVAQRGRRAGDRRPQDRRHHQGGRARRRRDRQGPLRRLASEARHPRRRDPAGRRIASTTRSPKPDGARTRPSS